MFSVIMYVLLTIVTLVNRIFNDCPVTSVDFLAFVSVDWRMLAGSATAPEHVSTVGEGKGCLSGWS